ncbi:DUF1697 domain-containing protein [Anoxybacterium hadale]|uniref:DUF1697 domain-containing protein n=1 Tax=Anoxybacterium hadale TaxID=3408580 RepID=A0ACD1A7P1_9FIRM|nr:DUF1697 domain-containing protein [Clostridiales bacterium]
MRYIALLRGINVGGNNKVAMKDLKACFERMGFSNVITYINSGNVLFSGEKQVMTELILFCEETLKNEFGFPIRTMVICEDDFQVAMAHAPDWWGDEPEVKHNVLFVIPPATGEGIVKEIGAIKPEYEKVGFYGALIFWSAPVKTFSRTRWSKIVGTRAYQDVTIRNSNTAKKLLELLQGD